MTTGIRFPADLRPPDRDGYGDTFEEVRRDFQPEVGPLRRRSRMRSAPRWFDVNWTFTDDQFAQFDSWWQDTIRGGEKEFDIQLLDDIDTLTWFTVRAFEPYKAERNNETQDWTVMWRFRALGDTFGTVRPAGTDELEGLAEVGMSGGGALQAYTPFRGLAEVGISATGRTNLPLLRGLAEVGMYRLPYGMLNPLPLNGVATIGISAATGNLIVATINYYPEESRQWMNLDWFGVLGAEDINTEQRAISLEWMEL